MFFIFFTSLISLLQHTQILLVASRQMSLCESLIYTKMNAIALNFLIVKVDGGWIQDLPGMQPDVPRYVVFTNKYMNEK